MATNAAYDRFFGGTETEIEPEDVAGLPIPSKIGRSSAPLGANASGWSSRLPSPEDAALVRGHSGAAHCRRPDMGRSADDPRPVERTMRLSLGEIDGLRGPRTQDPSGRIARVPPASREKLGPNSSPQARTYADRALAQTSKSGNSSSACST